MRKSEAIEHFGGAAKLAKMLDLTRQAIYMWPDEVPDLYQYKLHYLSKQQLPLSPGIAPSPDQGRAVA